MEHPGQILSETETEPIESSAEKYIRPRRWEMEDIEVERPERRMEATPEQMEKLELARERERQETQLVQEKKEIMAASQEFFDEALELAQVRVAMNTHREFLEALLHEGKWEEMVNMLANNLHRQKFERLDGYQGVNELKADLNLLKGDNRWYQMERKIKLKEIEKHLEDFERYFKLRGLYTNKYDEYKLPRRRDALCQRAADWEQGMVALGESDLLSGQEEKMSRLAERLKTYKVP